MAPKLKEYIQRKTNFVEINLYDNKVQVFKMERGMNSNLKI